MAAFYVLCRWRFCWRHQGYPASNIICCSLISLWMLTYSSLTCAFLPPSYSPCIEAGKYEFKWIFFWLHEWASKPFPPTPNHTSPSPAMKHHPLASHVPCRPAKPPSCNLPPLFSQLLSPIILLSPIHSLSRHYQVIRAILLIHWTWSDKFDPLST